MNKISDFKIRNFFKVNSKEQILSGRDAIIEYMRQLFSVLKTELWFDYEYGLEISNINENNIQLWILDNLSKIDLIKEVSKININRVENHFDIYLDVVLSDNSNLREEIKIKL